MADNPMVWVAAGVVVASALFLAWLSAKKGEKADEQRRERTRRRDIRLARGPSGNDNREPSMARRWDWLSKVEYPYWFAYERCEWPETPERDLGSSPWIYP